MVRETDLLKHLIHTAIQTADLQRVRLDDLFAKDFPYKQSKDFIEALKAFNNEILIILQNKETQFITLQTNADFDNFRSHIIQYTQLIWALNYITHIVERSTREHVSESTVLLLSHLTHKFNTAKFFVIPTFEYNYVYQNLREFSDTVTKMLPRTKNILDKLPDKLAVLSFPDIYKDNLIANSELAHEVGHFIDDIDQITKRIFSTIKPDPEKLYQYIKKDTEGLDYLAIERIKAKTLKKWRYSANRWILELVCDLIALRLCGPAFLFALAELLLTKQYPDEADEDYPPAVMRLELLLEELDSIKFLDNIANMENKKLIEELVGQIREHIKTFQNNEESILHETINSVKPLIKTQADISTRGFQYTPQKFATDVFQLLDRLKEYVPPCEIKRGTPADIISILNTGIIFRLTWKKYPPPIKIESIKDESYVIQIINSLVTKAIELSVIHQRLRGDSK